MWPMQTGKWQSPFPPWEHPIPSSPGQGHPCSKLLDLAGSTAGAPT